MRKLTVAWVDKVTLERQSNCLLVIVIMKKLTTIFTTII